jgi:hypothetical protein
MGRRVMEHDAMPRITQECGSTRLRCQNAKQPLLAQLDVQIRLRRNQANQALRLVRIDIVDHEVPLRHLWCSGDCPRDVGSKVRFRARRPDARRHDLTRYDIEVDHKRLCSMSGVLKLTPLNLAWSEWQAGILAFQGLDPRQFVRAHNPFAVLCPLGGLTVQAADVLDLGIKQRIHLGGQPVTTQMRLERD